MSDKLDLTFGMMLRAARLRWGWSARHGGFVRLQNLGTMVRVELHPVGLLPSPKKQAGEAFVIWWDEPGVLELIDPLATVRKIKRPVTFYVDTDGKLVKS